MKGQLLIALDPETSKVVLGCVQCIAGVIMFWIGAKTTRLFIKSRFAARLKKLHNQRLDQENKFKLESQFIKSRQLTRMELNVRGVPYYETASSFEVYERTVADGSDLPNDNLELFPTIIANNSQNM